MKKAILGFMLLFVIFIVTGCGSSGPDKNQMKAAIQLAAEDKAYEVIRKIIRAKAEYFVHDIGKGLVV